MKYILMSGEKDSYDRPITMYIDGVYNTFEEANKELMEHCVPKSDEMLEAIKNQETFVDLGYYDHYYLDYKNGMLSFFAKACQAENEYEGNSYQIIEWWLDE